MKTLRLSLAALTLAAVAAPLLAAEQSAPSDRGAEARGTRPHLRRFAELRAGERARLAERLGLTAEQQAQLKTKRSSIAETAKAIRQDSSLTPEQKKTKLRETLQSARTEMRSVLTPEQQAKLDQMRRRFHRAAHRRTSL